MAHGSPVVSLVPLFSVDNPLTLSTLAVARKVLSSSCTTLTCPLYMKSRMGPSWAMATPRRNIRGATAGCRRRT